MHLKRSFKSIASLYNRRQCIAFFGTNSFLCKEGNRLPIHRIHNLRLCKEGDVRSKRYGQCIKNLRFLIDQSPTYIAKGDVKIDALPP